MEQHKRITLNDIARLSGVSKTTVSMILNGQGKQFRIKPETCKRVEAIAKQHGYRANASAKALQAQRTNVIGLVIPDLTNYGFALTAKTLERLCRESGLQLVISCSDDNPHQEKRAIESLLNRQIDVLVTAPTHQDPHYYHSIVRHTPLLLLDRYVPNLNMPYVVSNDTPNVAALVAKMVQTYQLTEFFYLGGLLELSPSQSRLTGFKQGLMQANLPLQSDWIIHKNYQPEAGYQMLAEAVEQLGRLPKAIMTASYTLLEGVLRYLTEHQQMDKLLNGTLHLATFDDHDLLNALPFQIHSIRQNHEKLAHQLFELLKKTLKHRHFQSVQNDNQSVRVECDIIWRER